MITLKEIKAKIFNTECKNLLFEGLSRSEPILTKDEKGLIDNYFIYASNQDQTIVSKPMITFGIYSDSDSTAYINPDVYDEKADSVENRIEREKIGENYVDEYEALYSKVREFVYQRCNDMQKEDLKNYIEHLFYLSGSGLWQNYLTIFPTFFDWAREEEPDFHLLRKEIEE